jgi:hypothetical protein
MLYFCCDDERRRTAVRNHSSINGIDFLEVVDDPQDAVVDQQRKLLVHFIKSVSPGAITEKNVRIEGGERIRNITVTSVVDGQSSSPPQGSDVLIIEVSKHGDFSTYTLRLVADKNATDEKKDDPPDGFDPVLSAVDFSFKVNCPTSFDCKPQRLCPTEPGKNPEINYLAKDYASFRQLMLDRMSLLMPDWKERSAADLGIVLIELLAYAGDYLSYQQDAVATESYLNTARRRASVRRHAKLVDYPMHDGRNARTWVHVEVTKQGDGLVLSRGAGRDTTKLLTGVGVLENINVVSQTSNAFSMALAERPQIFELLDEIKLFESHNRMRFYTWGARECCLPKGATQATLDGAFSNLKAGDVLVLVENRGPETGKPEDADRTRRHAVRLTSVHSDVSDPVGGQFKSPPDNFGVKVTQIEWAADDALPFALCVSTTVDNHFFDDGALALGNIVLVDHGHTVTDVLANLPADLELVDTSLDPPVVPGPITALTRMTPSAASRCDSATVSTVAPRYRPRLKFSPITQASPYDPDSPPKSASATRKLFFEDSKTLPVPEITLKDPGPTGVEWKPRRDLLGSDSGDEVFVVEVETDGTAYLRFGDGQTGRRPPEGVKFLATYRIGNGTAGNIGADSIKHMVTSDPAFLDPSAKIIESISNPLPATGGVDPETIEHVRQNAPSAFRRQERAVTPADYEALTIRKDVVQRCGLDIQQSSAMLRWTGSWHTMFLTVDRLGGRVVEPEFEDDLRQCLERYRMAGQDLEIDGPLHVSLEIEMKICIKPGYFFEDVQEALLKVFSNRTQTDGSRGVFHPDNFSFGQPVLLSRIIAAAQSVTGVASVEVTKFQRQGIDSNAALESGSLVIGLREIARLDNDPNFPERGVIILKRA